MKYECMVSDEAGGTVDRRKCAPFDKDDLQTLIVRWKTQQKIDDSISSEFQWGTHTFLTITITLGGEILN